MIGTVKLKEMELYGYHGCFEEEKIIGNYFILNFSARYNMGEAARSDSLNSAINYQELYTLIKEEFSISSNLLENVAYRIMESCRESFPSIIEAKIEISKLNPPLGGKVAASKVMLESTF